MKYVFFDIEGADPKLRTIYSFGYVVTDENFNIIVSDDIAINPKSRYNRYVAKNIIRYSIEDLKSQPTFDEIYPILKTILESPDVSVFGFSIINDLNYLNAECKRYGLDALTFPFYDIQKQLCLYYEQKNQIGLQTAAETLGIEQDDDRHRSDADAILSMLVLKAMSEQNIASPKSGFAPEATGNNADYTFTWNGTPKKKKTLKSQLDNK